jgi:homoserine dehydrogenase
MLLRVVSLGFGNVGKALAQMLAEKETELKSAHGVEIVFVGAITRRHGAWTSSEGIRAEAVQRSGWPGGDLPHGATRFDGSTEELARLPHADVVLELTPLKPADGEPALTYIRAALSAGKHVVTANKGPIAHGLSALRKLAAERGRLLRFESTVMDGTPIFGMAQACLPATRIEGFSGVLNSTSNFVLGKMEAGASLDQAVAAAQAIGIAEENPAYDLDGWDASVKACALANALMGAELRPAEVQREGLGREAMVAAIASRAQGARIKQIVEVRRASDRIDARVRLESFAAGSLFGALSGMEAALKLRTDTLGELTLVEGEGGPAQTALGVMADLVAIARGRTVGPQ